MPIKLDMSIEETIEHLDQIANNQFECADRIDELHCDSTSTRNMASYHKRLAEWLKELKAYREDTRFADLYERICIKRDDDREYFARTKDKTYITRIAEKEMFIHMMQDMMFDRYGVEEVNADDE